MLQIEQLSELAKRQTFNAAEKAEIKATADAVGISYNVKRGCQNCYQDLVVEIYSYLKKLNSKFEPARKYKLKAGVDVQVGYPQGKRLNAATVTDEWAEQLIERGLTKYFEDAN